MFTAALPRQDLLLTLTSWDAILMMRNYSLHCRFFAKLCQFATVVIMQNRIRAFEHCCIRNFDALGSQLSMSDLQIFQKERFDRERLETFANIYHLQ